MSALVVYYSLGGTTRTVANELAGHLGGDIEEIRCDRYQPGAIGALIAVYDSVMGCMPPVEHLTHLAPRQGLVVLCGPIWAFHAATPLRACLLQDGRRLPTIAFVLTHGGSSPDKAFRELELLAGKQPRASIAVSEANVKSGAYRSQLSAFADSLAIRQAA